MQLTTASKNGKLAVVVSGEISDADGNIIGNLHLIEKKALDAWEVFLSKFNAEDLNDD